MKGEWQLIANRLMLEQYIVANGHLVMEGNETTTELREALLYLRQHTYRNCHRPELGTPIEVFTPDISVLVGKSTGRPRLVRNVDTSDERL